MAVHSELTDELQEPVLEPAIFVIFGITGDLAHRRLLPALYHLLKDKLLHEHTQIVGVSRQAVDVGKLLDQIKTRVMADDDTCDPAVLDELRRKLHMVQFDPVQPEQYDAFLATLHGIEETHGMCMNRLYYLAIPPDIYPAIIQNFGEHGLQFGCQHRRAVSRLLVEKPFGSDLASAEALIRHTARYFHERQVFRIDHYLAKEAAQDMLVFRQQNPLFAGLWNNQHISGINVAFYEQIDIEGRGRFYDGVGALRDVVQNHLLQLLTLATMDLPDDLSSNKALHTAREQLLEHISPVDVRHGHVVRGQYAGYRDEVPDRYSATETYAALTTAIDTDRWRGVPVRLTAGKALKSKYTAVTITFAGKTPAASNQLTFRIQPNEGIDIALTVKRPGFAGRTERVEMNFSYRGALNEPEHPDAYERVLVDAVCGDHALFTSNKEILAEWRVLQPVLDAWKQRSDDLQIYERGSDGPAG